MFVNPATTHLRVASCGAPPYHPAYRPSGPSRYVADWRGCRPPASTRRLMSSAALGPPGCCGPACRVPFLISWQSRGNVNAAKVSSAIQVVRAREGTTRRGMDCCKRCLSRFQVWTTATSRLTRCWPLSEPISPNNEPDERVCHAKGCERSWPISPTESSAPLRYRALASLRLVG
jgi:hypothetical protein